MNTSNILKIDADTSSAITSINDLRKALKETKDAMAGLEEGTDAWNELAHAAGEYQHQLQAINESVRGASSDFGDMLGNVTNVGAGITGAFQTAQAALSMFGVESEEVTKSIKTMQNMMAMTQGLGSIDKAIKSLNKLEKSWGKVGVAISKVIKTASPMLAWAAVIAGIGVAFVKLKERIDGTATALSKRTEQQKLFNEEVEREAAIRAKAGDSEISILEYEIESYSKRNEELEETNKKLKEENDSVTKLSMNATNAAGAFGGAVAATAAFNGVAQEMNVNVSANTKLIEENRKEIEENNKQIETWTKNLEDAQEIQRRLKNKKNASGAGDNKTQYDYDVNKLNVQRELVSGTKKELEFLRQIVVLKKEYADSSEKEVKLTKEKIKANEEELKKLNKQLDYIKAQRDYIKTMDSYIQNLLTVDAVSEQISIIMADMGVGLIDVNDAIASIYKAQVKILEINEENSKIIEKTSGYIVGEEAEIEYEVKFYKEILDILKNLPEKTKEQAEAQKLLSELLERQRDLEEEKVRLILEKRLADNDEIKYNKLILSLEEDKLEYLTEGTVEWYRQLAVVNEVKKTVSELEKERTDIQVELENRARIYGVGELQILNEQLAIEESKLETIKKGTVEYERQRKVVDDLKVEMNDVRVAAVNVATQGIGFIGDMLSSLADMQDTNTKEGFEQQKKLSASSTIMNGIGATISAVASWMNPANAWMTAPVQAAMAAAQSIAIAASTAAQVKQILATKFDSSSSVSSGAINSLTLVPPVQYSSLVQNANIEENTRSTTSYVSVTEIERVGQRVSVAESESRY